jgi:heat-inducible transcriptional repressor
VLKEVVNVLDKRKKEILQAVIDEYISTAEPVSSATLVSKYGLDYSSATVRNELAELESNGYLEKPHTSAGRVPSEKGYRFYVDELVNDQDISVEEIKYIQNKLSAKVNEIEDLTKIATSTLSEITHYTTVAIGPKSNMQIIEEIKFVLLGTRMLMVVIVTDSGLVKETIIKYDEDISQSQVETLNSLFNSKLKGKPLSKIDKPMEEYIYLEINDSIEVIKPIIEQINKVVEDENKLYLEGANKSFDLPEFKSLEIAKNFVNILDEKDLVLDMLNSGIAKDINVYIGEENENEQLKDFSIVTFKHSVGDKDLGTIGIIGPKRMDYSKVISVMKYISKKMNEKDI